MPTRSSTRATVADRATRWVTPAVGIAMGVAYLLAGVVAGNLAFVLIGFGIMAALSVGLVLAARRSETVRGLLDRRDERISALDWRATDHRERPDRRDPRRVRRRDRPRRGRHAVCLARRRGRRRLRGRADRAPRPRLSARPRSHRAGDADHAAVLRRIRRPPRCRPPPTTGTPTCCGSTGASACWSRTSAPCSRCSHRMSGPASSVRSARSWSPGSPTSWPPRGCTRTFSGRMTTRSGSRRPLNDLAVLCEHSVAAAGGLARLDLAGLHRRLQRNLCSARDYVPAIELATARARS